MDKAIIIGTYEFLGFHFCKRILEEGIEVIGIHLGFDDEKLLIEEKRLEIGRNANFTERKITDLHSEEFNQEEVVLFIDFYDIFMREFDNQFFEKGILKEILTHSQRENFKIIFLLPTSVLSSDTFQQTTLLFNDWKEEVLKKGLTMQEFYLPTIFGPWQSDVFLFQKVLITDKVTTNISNREWTGDALYIDDVVNEILDAERENQKVLLKSNEKNRWGKCAELLKIPYGELREPAIVFTGVEKKAEQVTPIEEGLESQKRLIKTLRLHD